MPILIITSCLFSLVAFHAYLKNAYDMLALFSAVTVMSILFHGTKSTEWAKSCPSLFSAVRITDMVIAHAAYAYVTLHLTLLYSKLIVLSLVIFIIWMKVNMHHKEMQKSDASGLEDKVQQLWHALFHVVSIFAANSFIYYHY